MRATIFRAGGIERRGGGGRRSRRRVRDRCVGGSWRAPGRRSPALYGRCVCIGLMAKARERWGFRVAPETGRLVRQAAQAAERTRRLAAAATSAASSSSIAGSSLISPSSMFGRSGSTSPPQGAWGSGIRLSAPAEDPDSNEHPARADTPRASSTSASSEGAARRASTFYRRSRTRKAAAPTPSTVVPRTTAIQGSVNASVRQPAIPTAGRNRGQRRSRARSVSADALAMA